MAVFFFLSGFVSVQYWLTGEVELRYVMKKKIWRLLIPYFVLSVGTLCIKVFGGVITHVKFNILWETILGKSPNESLWYLWTLFCLSVLIVVIGKSLKHVSVRIKTVIFVFIGLTLYGIQEVYDVAYMENICKYLVFYILGGIVRNNYLFLKKNICYVSISILSMGLTLVLANPDLHISMYLATGILGIYFIMVLSIRIAERKETFSYKLLDCFGHYSYEIYLLSYFVQTFVRVIGSLTGVPYMLIVGIMFVFSIFIPICTSKYVIRRSKLLKVLLGL